MYYTLQNTHYTLNCKHYSIIQRNCPSQSLSSYLLSYFLRGSGSLSHGKHISPKDCVVLIQVKSLIVVKAFLVEAALKGGGGGGGGGITLEKKDFELGVGGEGQDTSRHFEGSFGPIRSILLM